LEGYNIILLIISLLKKHFPKHKTMLLNLCLFETQLCVVKLRKAGVKNSNGQYFGNRAARDRTRLDDSG